MKKQHLIIDGYKCNKDKINDKRLIEDFLVKTIEMVSMRWLSPVKVYPALEGESPGLTGGGIISTSHIYVHTFTDDTELNFDLFSCKPFNKKEVVHHIKKTFDIKKIITRQFKR